MSDQIWEGIIDQEDWVRYILFAAEEKIENINIINDGCINIKFRKNNIELALIKRSIDKGREALIAFERESSRDNYNFLSLKYFSQASFHAGIIFAACEFESADREKYLRWQTNLGHQGALSQKVWVSKHLKIYLNSASRSDVEHFISKCIWDLIAQDKLNEDQKKWFQKILKQRKNNYDKANNKKLIGTARANIKNNLGLADVYRDNKLYGKHIERFSARSDIEIPPSLVEFGFSEPEWKSSPRARKGKGKG